MRDLNIPRVDEVPAVEGFETTTTPQNAVGYATGADQTVLDPTQTNPYQTIDPRVLEMLMQSQKNVAPANTTLPPNYYYPDADRGVTVGQMSGPLGSMSLITPGAPLFPMSIMDAVQKEEKASKAKWLEDQLKPFEYDYTHLDQVGLDDEWVGYQTERYKGLEQKYLKMAGDNYGMARQLATRDNAFKKEAAELQAMKKNIDTSYAMAMNIVKTKDENGEYVSPRVYEEANKYLEMLSAGDFKENFDAIQNARKNFVQVENIEKSYAVPVAAMSTSFVESEYLIDLRKAGAVDANGNVVNPTLWQTTINKTAERIKKIGANAFSEEEINAAADNAYNREYSKYMKDKGFALMPIEEYRRNFKDAIGKSIDYETEKLTETDAWNQQRAKKSVWETKITPTLDKVRVGTTGFETDAQIWGLPSSAWFDTKGNVTGRVFNPSTGEFQSGASSTGGRIVSIARVKDPNGKWVSVAAVAKPENFTEFKLDAGGKYNVSYGNPSVKWIELNDNVYGQVQSGLVKTNSRLEGFENAIGGEQSESIYLTGYGVGGQYKGMESTDEYNISRGGKYSNLAPVKTK